MSGKMGWKVHKIVSALPLRNIIYDFSGGPAVKNLPVNARDMGSSPDPGKIPPAGGQLVVHHNYWASMLEPVLCNKGSHHNE